MEKQEKITTLFKRKQNMFLSKKKFLFKVLFKNLSVVGNNDNCLLPFYILRKKYFSYYNIYNLNFYFNYKNCILKIKNKKSEKSCIVLFKKKDYFFIIHVYVNKKLIYLTNYEKKHKKIGYFRYFRYIAERVKFIVFNNSRFNNLYFVFQIKKKRRKLRKKINRFKKKKSLKKKNRKTKTFLYYNFIKLAFRFIKFFIKNKKKPVKVKYLFNKSHSFIREKIKKKRRK